MGSNNRHKIQ